MTIRLSRRAVLSSLLASPVLLSVRHAFAQVAWPGKAINYVVPYPPGGTTDVLARLIAARLGSSLNATVFVENKPGATGAIGTEFVARAPGDGHTLLQTSTGPQAIVPNLRLNIGYAPEKSFEPVILIGTIPSVIIVAANSPFKTVADVIGEAKKKPGSISYASGGIGTILHVAGELMKLQAGIELVHVPYKGDTPAIQDVIAGHVAMMFAPVTPILPHLQAGRLRALAVASPKRLKSLPAVPTTAEAGLRNVEAEQWQAIYATAGTPKPVVQRLNEEVAKILADPEIADRLEELGVTAVGGDPDALAAYQEAEIAKWGNVISKAGIKLE